MLRQRVDRVPGDIVISGRYQQTVLWAAFIVILAPGLAEAVHAQSTSTGKTQAGIFFGVFIAVCALLWWRRNRRRPRLQMTGPEIRYWDGRGNLSFMLAHDPGQPGVLCLLPPRRDAGRYAGRCLTIPGSGDYMSVTLFRPRQLRQACQSRGWRFDDDPAVLARESATHADLLRRSSQQRTLPQ
jgi:hypothetical protein